MLACDLSTADFSGCGLDSALLTQHGRCRNCGLASWQHPIPTKPKQNASELVASSADSSSSSLPADSSSSLSDDSSSLPTHMIITRERSTDNAFSERPLLNEDSEAPTSDHVHTFDGTSVSSAGASTSVVTAADSTTSASTTTAPDTTPTNTPSSATTAETATTAVTTTTVTDTTFVSASQSNPALSAALATTPSANNTAATNLSTPVTRTRAATSTPPSTPPFSSFPSPISIPRTPPCSSTSPSSFHTPPSLHCNSSTCSSTPPPSTFRYHYHSPIESTFTFDPFSSLQQSSMRMFHKMKDFIHEKHNQDEKNNGAQNNSHRSVLHASKSSNCSSNTDSVARKLYKNSPDVKRILLLGGGSVGKSTLFKQLVNIFGGGFGDRERAYYLPLLVENVVCQIQDLLAVKHEAVAAICPDLRDAAKLVCEIPEQGLVSSINAKHILEIWKDPSMVDRLDIVRGLPNPHYVIPRIKNFAEPGYIPSVQDVLAARARTTGIIEHSFSHSFSPSSPPQQYQVFDTGGERNERKKWVHLYEDNPCVVLVVNLFGYCVTLNEDATVNRMSEDLQLFEEIVNLKHFEESVVCVVFNQKDKFRTAIQRGGMVPAQATDGAPKNVDCTKIYSLNLLFSDYTGGNDEEKALEFVHEKFKKFNRRSSHSPPVLYFDTNALDTREVAKIFRSLFELTQPSPSWEAS